ncbi:hypothetical protein EGW08_016612 [Elysia chlorotica]|uniref:Integrase catalytic domain-containing protein n=1 Tax=Elysia chlorotica TaxID=188477 RepID=A0A3S1HAX4_ELYCH|nr:hypothetical protein EGW08_016612 [Elysia chlorotica]
MDLKIRLIEKEAELLRLRPAGSADKTVVKAGQAKAPKLPEFQEGRDDMESYLLRFERFAATNNWPRTDWTTHLSALLSAKALDTYSRLSEEESMDYKRVKKALLMRYNLTSEGFNSKFRTSRPEAGERMRIFSRVGLPSEILSDCGAQFTSDLMKEVCRLLSIKQLTTTPYHPQANGLVERFNGTIKSIIKKLASERPRDWDRYLPAALFSYREAPQESLGFPPFELMFGRTVRGPMAVLRDLWIGETEDPDAHNKLQVSWQGPFEITEVKGNNNYKVNLGEREKTFHINILKRYHSRSSFETEEIGQNVEKGTLQCAVSAVISEKEEADEMGQGEDMETSILIETPVCLQTETPADVDLYDGLETKRKEQIKEILREFSDVLTDVPGQTDLIEHEIKLTSEVPIRKKPYPVPQSLRETMRNEVDNMIEAGIIEPSNSPYCSPSVIVSKRDGSNRYCIDFRALNNISIFDAEPMVRPDDIFQEIGSKSNYLSKVDLSKGYWQIPLTETSKTYTAFATERGLYQFRVMPFGLQGAPATFSRLMRKVTNGLPNLRNYLDDCLIFTETWEEHVEALRALFTRLREVGLTARPTKCSIAYPRLEFLGHMVGSGNMQPTCDKVEAIRNANPPQTKKEMRSFMGLASFYRRYVPHFSTMPPEKENPIALFGKSLS